MFFEATSVALIDPPSIGAHLHEVEASLPAQRARFVVADLTQCAADIAARMAIDADTAVLACHELRHLPTFS